ncbi:MAG: response regulator transcription factor [Halobacteriovoraceae bacterium]|nr:response regulator transcription factor [Halobacteriovoraceae bacterium]
MTLALKKQTILLVEDDPSLKETVVELLEGDSDYKVITAGSLPEANTKVQNQKFSCIILDWHLREGQTSEKLIRTIRQKSKTVKNMNFDTPIIILSGALNTVIINKIILLVDSILVKPFQPEQLINQIDQFVKNGRPKKSA